MQVVLSKPYWRWHRWNKRRGRFTPKGAIAKPWNGLIALLIAADLTAKHVLNTQDWAWHTQPRSWLIVPAVCILMALPFMFFPLTRVPAALMIAGSAGNGISAANGAVANPFVANSMAFNVADIYLAAALATAMATCLILIRRIV